MTLMMFMLVLAQDQSWIGPLTTGTKNPMVSYFHPLRPDHVSINDKGKIDLFIHSDLSNMHEVRQGDEWNQDLDMEALNNDLDLRVGLGLGFEMGLQATFTSSWGGSFDDLIQDFHEALGLPNDNRDEYENNRHVFRFFQRGLDLDGESTMLPIFDADERRFEHVRRGLYLRARTSVLEQPLVFKAAYYESSGTWGPVGNSSSISLEASFTRNLKKAAWHSHVAWIQLDPSNMLEPVIKDRVFQLVQGLEASRWGWQFLGQIAYASDFYERTGLDTLDNPLVNLSLGVGKHTKRSQWQVSFSEDISAKGPAIDISLNVSFRTTIKAP